jgi:putative adhesin
MSMHPARSRRLPAAALAVLLMLAMAGCVGMGPLAGKATDESTKSYPLAAGGELRIDNTNGKVDIEGVDGSTVEVHATKVAYATTDAAARELLPRISIKEEITPSRVSVATERMNGVMIGARFEVQYHVKVPKNAVVNAMTSNGGVTLSGLAGNVAARTTNGGVKGTDLTGAVEARSTNGGVTIELAAVGKDKIFLSTTNGGVTLTLPETAKADISATCTNGGISVTGLKLETTEESRRRLEGKLNGGGAPIELHTTNGGIRVRARAG